MNKYVEHLRMRYVPEEKREKAEITAKELSKDVPFARAIGSKITCHVHPDRQTTESKKQVMRAIQVSLNKIVNTLKGLV